MKYAPGAIAKLDQRTAVAIKLKRAYREIVSDLGGFDALSHIQLSYVERFVWLEWTLQKLETQIAKKPERAEKIMSRWIQGHNSLQGLGKILGINRRPKTLSLQEHLDAKSAKRKHK
ncbi:MAG TPA: hypothetical protein VGG64_09375 [Pirellulales bacterium]|jgi:hypothetical protein